MDIVGAGLGHRVLGQPNFHSGPRHHGGPSLWASSLWRARISFWASSSRRALTLGVVIMARPQSLSLAGRARNTDGTHPRASSGARSVVSGPFPEVLSPAWRRASSACDRTDPAELAELLVGLGLGGVGGRACPPPSQPSPGRPSFRRPSESPWHPLNPFSSVPMASKSSAVWAGRSGSPQPGTRHGTGVVALAPLASLTFGPVVKEEPAASSTS